MGLWARSGHLSSDANLPVREIVPLRTLVVAEDRFGLEVVFAASVCNLVGTKGRCGLINSVLRAIRCC